MGRRNGGKEEEKRGRRREKKKKKINKRQTDRRGRWGSKVGKEVYIPCRKKKKRKEREIDVSFVSFPIQRSFASIVRAFKVSTVCSSCSSSPKRRISDLYLYCVRRLM